MGRITKILMAVSLIISAFSFHSTIVRADGPTIVYVNDEYNETTPGWNVTNFSSIQAGINAVAENGMVYVYNGTYTENIIVNKSIDLIGEFRDNTTLNGTAIVDEKRIIIESDNVNITGFTIYFCYYNLYIDGYSDINITNCYFDWGSRHVYANNVNNLSLFNNYCNFTSGIAFEITNSENITIFDNIMESVDGGIKIDNCLFIDILGNEINDTLSGISIINNARNVTIDDNDLTNTNGNAAIRFVTGVHWCIISNNRILLSTNQDGISVWHSYNNSIWGNTIEFANEDGIEIVNSSIITIYENIIKNNSIGINISTFGSYPESEDIEIYHNDFIDNTIQAWDECDNYWDDGRWGNYWNDYMGVDAEGDRIGDTPYNISGGSNQDNYPMLDPWVGPPDPVTVYVDDDYNESTSGWGYDHFDIIEDGTLALSSTATHGLVYVYSGEYYNPGSIPIYNKMNLTGEDKNTTIIDGWHGTDLLVTANNAEYSIISGFTFRNGGGSDAAILGYEELITVHDCIFNNNYWDIRNEANNWEIYDCEFIGSRHSSIRFQDGDNSLIHNNTFLETDFAVYIHFHSDGNTIVDNYIETVGGAIHFAYYCNDNYFLRNQVIGNETPLVDINQMGDTTTSTDNHIYHNNFYNGSDPFGYIDWHPTPESNHYNDSSLGNFYDDYEQRYPAAGNDGTIWDTPLEYEQGNQQDNYPLVEPYDYTGPLPPPPECPWDLNDDGIVNYLDASILIADYGSSGSPGWIPSDINEDGIVNYLDASILVEHYGELCPECEQ